MNMVLGYFCDGSAPDSHLHEICFTEEQAFAYASEMRGSRVQWGRFPRLIGRTWLEHEEDSGQGEGGRVMGEVIATLLSEK